MREITLANTLQLFVDLLDSTANSELNVLDALRREDLTAYARVALFKGKPEPELDVRIPSIVWAHDVPGHYDLVVDWEESGVSADPHDPTNFMSIVWAERVYLDERKVATFIKGVRIGLAKVQSGEESLPEKRKPGRPVVIGDKIKEAMRNMDRAKLRAMTGVVMQAEFKKHGRDPRKGPSINTCKKCRDEVENEPP